METEKKLSKITTTVIITNAFLMVVMLGVLIWLGAETKINSVSLIEVKATQKLNTQVTLDSFVRVENTIGNTIAKREYDIRMLSIESKLTELAVKLHEIDVILLKLQVK